MKTLLKREEPKCYHFVGGGKIYGAPPDLRGDVTGLWGDADACEITDEEREAGIDVALLIGGAK